MKRFEREKSELETLKYDNNMPEDFKNELISFKQEFISSEEKSIKKLKSKIK